MRIPCVVVASCLAAIITPGSAAADNEKQLAVVVTGNVNIGRQEALEFSDQVARTLESRYQVVASGGQRLTRVLPAQGLSGECLNDSSCLVDLGKRLGADELLLVNLVRLGASIQIDVVWLDVGTGKSSVRPTVRVSKLDVGAAAIERAIGSWAPGLVPRPIETRREITTGMILTGSASAAVTVGAVVLAVIAYDRSGKCDEQDPDPECDEAFADKTNDLALYADIAGAVGAIGFAGTALWYFLSESPERPMVGVSPTRGGFTVGYTTTF